MNRLILLIILFSSAAMADDDPDTAFANGDYAAARDGYAALVAQEPENGQAWYRLAVSHRETGDLGKSREAIARAEDLGFAPLRVTFEKARIAAVDGDTAVAVAELQSMVDAGFSGVGFVNQDPVLSALAGDAGFDALIETMTAAAYPCENDPAFAEFDFWVGEWDVHAGGAYAGSNVIALEQRGCVLVENWTSATGGRGTSINYLDRTTDEWVQIWNAEGGSQIHIRGGMTEDGMLLEGTIHYVSNGTTAPFRGLWTPLDDGRVRQFFEQSNDGGETWTPWFEGFYTRKAVVGHTDEQPD